MNNDGVSIAFELIADELEKVAQTVADQGALAFKERRHDDAKNLSETGKNLHGFIQKINSLMEEWQAGIDVNVRRRIKIDEIRIIRSRPSHTKSRKTRLRVRFNDGREINDYFAADTFAMAIKEMGIPKVEALGITERGLPLVGTQRSRDYNQRQIDGRYICVHSSTKEKKETLETIARRLGVGLKVEVIQ